MGGGGGGETEKELHNFYLRLSVCQQFSCYDTYSQCGAASLERCATELSGPR